MSKTFGALLTERREELSRSTAEVAQRSKLPLTTIIQLELGTRPFNGTYLSGLCLAYGWTPTILLNHWMNSLLAQTLRQAEIPIERWSALVTYTRDVHEKAN